MRVHKRPPCPFLRYDRGSPGIKKTIVQRIASEVRRAELRPRPDALGAPVNSAAAAEVDATAAGGKTVRHIGIRNRVFLKTHSGRIADALNDRGLIIPPAAFPCIASAAFRTTRVVGIPSAVDQAAPFLAADITLASPSLPIVSAHQAAPAPLPAPPPRAPGPPPWGVSRLPG